MCITLIYNYAKDKLMNTKRGMLFTLLLIGGSNLFGADAEGHRDSPTDKMLKVNLGLKSEMKVEFGSEASNVAARALQERLRVVANERDNAQKTIEKLTIELAAAEAAKNGISIESVEAIFRALISGEGAV